MEQLQNLVAHPRDHRAVDDVDDGDEGVCAVERRGRAANDLDLLDVFRWHAVDHTGIAEKQVVDPLAIDHHEDPLGSHAAPTTDIDRQVMVTLVRIRHEAGNEVQ